MHLTFFTTLKKRKIKLYNHYCVDLNQRKKRWKYLDVVDVNNVAFFQPVFIMQISHFLINQRYF